VNTFPNELRDYHKLLDRNRIFFERNEAVGVLRTEDALSSGATGPVLRAAGLRARHQKISPYLRYNEVEFEIPTRLEGDNLARYYVRMEEMSESIRIIRSALKNFRKAPSERTMQNKRIHPKMRFITRWKV
jgi:NADH-quinone oxidoreductase subunit D